MTNKSICFFDIETFQYNERAGYEKPSLFKNMTYSVAISFWDNEELKISLFPNFKDFFECICSALKLNRASGLFSCKARINLIAHNNNRYDNHFLRKDIKYFYPNVTIHNAYLTNAVKNDNTIKNKEISKNKTKFQKCDIYEKRVKTSINLEFDFYLLGIHFKTVDNFPKTGLSIATLGKKLKGLGVLTDNELKTEFDYLEFNEKEDMTEKVARQKASYIWHNLLTDKHETYIKNDVIILAKSWYYYNNLFPSFDYDKITYTSNILDSYLINEKTRYQLLKRVKRNGKIEQIKYTDYRFMNINMYDYFKLFYYGGLNFYNQIYLGKIINEPMFTIDLNSSYPYVMYNFKIPQMIFKYSEIPSKVVLNLSNDSIFTVYEISFKEMNHLLDHLKSDMIRKLLVKYYKVVDGNCHINSNTLRVINMFSEKKITELNCISFVSFTCDYFSGREKIFDYYKIKSQGKLTKKLVMETPQKYTILDEENKEVFNDEEIYNAKVKMNGLYGIPALRAFFNLFRVNEEDEIENIPNGFKNSERNIVFSVFVTSQALFNLLQPLSYLDDSEIDECLIYGDTDSLYIKKKVMDKIPSNFYDPISLGAWGVDDDTITQFYVINHKKYTYYSSKKNKIILKCGGIPQDAFNFEYKNLDDFVANEFHEGKEVINKRNIFTQEKQIAIYDGIVKIEKGFNYFSTYSKIHENQKNILLNQLREKRDFKDFTPITFYGTPYGTFSDLELFPMTQEIEGKKTIEQLIAKEQVFERWLENELE